jgi:Winged helix DNA-binding domain
MRDRFAVPRTLPPDLARGLLVRAQRLGGPEREDGASVADVVRVVGGLQAQDAPAAALGVRARLGGATASGVDRARFEERSVARIWCMRGTLHLVAAEDARWLVALLGPVGLARGRRRREQMGVVNPEASAAVRAALADGPRTRREIAEHARAGGLAVADDPQAPAHLVMTAALEGHVIEAAWRGREPTYALTDDWLGPARPLPERDAALAELARRHARAHPPAGPEDLAAWSGLRMADARCAFAAIAGELEEVEVLGRRAWVPRGLEPAAPAVRLLPAFDGILLGHRDRELTVRPEHARAVLPGGGILRPTVLADGLVEGTWRFERGAPDIAPFDAPGPDVAAEIADVVRFRAG